MLYFRNKIFIYSDASEVKKHIDKPREKV